MSTINIIDENNSFNAVIDTHPYLPNQGEAKQKSTPLSSTDQV